MLNVEGYKIIEELPHAGFNRLYRANRLEDGHPFILKTHDPTITSPHSRTRISHEFEIGKHLDGEGAGHYTAALKVGHSMVLAIEDFGGISLRTYFNELQSLEDKLHIASRIAVQLSRIHAKGVVHKDVKPDNILINPKTKEAVFIDFGLSVQVLNNGRSNALANTAEGSPQYFAPEQTGRVNLSVDFRSDLYAFGITLFEILAGRLPFPDESLNDLVYAQIAKQAPRLSSILPDIPQAVDAVVNKLLQKAPANRYQSALGLVHDLEACLQVIAGKMRDQDFQPGSNDFSSRFMVSNRLVGRKAEIQLLKESFQRVIGAGKELVLISGEAGSGKSVLVRELLPSLAMHNGLFITGKFDQQRGGTPYEGIVAALRDLADFLMRQSKNALEEWCSKIQQGLGGLTRLLVDLVPEFQRVLGAQPALPEVMPEEAQARFTVAMKGLFRSIATAEHPVILFLDDLQWADNNTAQLIQGLLMDFEIRHLMIVGASRGTASKDQDEDLSSFELIGKDYPYHHIRLQALDEAAVAELISDSFPRNLGNVQALSALVVAKTAGNPFFVNEFLGNLFERKLLSWDEHQNAWTWDISAIQNAQFTGNVIDYLCARVNRLDAEVLELLKLASCIGSKFELSSLAVLTRQSMADVEQKLEPAVAENILLPKATGFLDQKNEDIAVDAIPAKGMDFVHDRVREAVYSLLDEAQKTQYHLRIGQVGLEHLAHDRNIFEIATHLNLGSSLVSDRAQLDRFAAVNLDATRRATTAAAFSAAMRFAKAGIALMGENGWKDQYATTFALHSEHASLLFLLEDPKAAEAAFQKLNSMANTRLEKLKLAMTHIQLLVHTGDFKQCEAVGAGALAMFGLKYPSQKKIKGAILGLLVQSKLKMIGMNEQKLLALPPVKDPEMKAFMELLSYLGLAFGAFNAELFTYVALVGLKLMLKHGVADPMTSVIHYYGLILLMAFGDHKNAYQFSSMSLKMFDLHPSVSFMERTAFGFYGWIALWKDDVRTLAPRFAAIKAKALEYGDMIIAALAEDMRLWFLSLTGYPLAQLEEDCNHHLSFLSQRSEDQSVTLMRALVTAKRSLAGENPDPSLLDSDAFNFQEIRKDLLAKGSENVLGGMYTKWMQLLFLFGNDDALIPIIDEGHLCIAKMANTFVPTEYYLFETLILFRLLERKDLPQRAALQKHLTANMKLIAVWDKRCALNFAVFNHLVLGEQARVAGKVSVADEHFFHAIQIAEEKNWIHLVAVANELAARHQLQQGKIQFARTFLQEARSNYAEWGATAKVKQLEANHREILPRVDRYGSTSLTKSSGRISEDVDLASILQSSQVISSQIKVDGLLRELMAILIRNAGAERGSFLMYQENGIFIKARGESSDNSTELLDDISAFGTGLLPESVLHYVDNKREPVILENAQQNLKFGSDTYFQTHVCFSVMMVPVLKEGRMLGIIYLENGQAPEIFTPERVQVIQMLAGQIAVSIDNAHVYENLERLVEERTLEIRRQKDQIAVQNEALEKEKQKSDDLLLNILPKEIAEELKATGKAKAQKFAQATVIFTDIIGFTQIAEQLTPEELVQELDLCFSAFDKIQKKFGLEKVKTIGDAYMCMAGVPVVREDSAVRAIFAGLEMQEFMMKLAEEKKELGMQCFKMRLGMHTGEIVAGVVGTEKFAYDIWGDTVNLAARLESAGQSGKVNISAETCRLVQDYFEFEHRGQVSIKNKNDVDMYFVTAIKPRGMELLAHITSN